MNQPKPASSANTAKNGTIIAITLAVLLHILIAIIIYSTIFKHNKLSERETLPLATDDQNFSSLVKHKQQMPNISRENNADKQVIQSVESRDNDALSHNKAVADSENQPGHKNTTKPIAQDTPPNISSQRKTNKDNDSLLNAQASTPYLNTHKPENIETLTNDQKNQSEYKLKQSKEYERLDAEIDNNNERLSKLITEIKKHNQSQIQQHHLPKAGETSSDNTPMVQHDYPITPITSLPPKERSAKDAENSPTNQ